MTTLTKIFVWLARSSRNSSQWSLTSKAILTGTITFITMVANLAGVSIPGPEVLTQALDGVIAVIQAFVFLISTLTTAYGIIRKVYTTIIGQNAVINNHPVFNEGSDTI